MDAPRGEARFLALVSAIRPVVLAIDELEVLG
jgi:hypothetical protein